MYYSRRGSALGPSRDQLAKDIPSVSLGVGGVEETNGSEGGLARFASSDPRKDTELTTGGVRRGLGEQGLTGECVSCSTSGIPVVNGLLPSRSGFAILEAVAADRKELRVTLPGDDDANDIGSASRASFCFGAGNFHVLRLALMFL